MAGLLPAFRAAPRLGISQARSMQIHPQHVGLINSPVAGRTDKINLHVGAGSYVVPADVVSGAGQGNTSAGAKTLTHMLTAGPYGLPAGKPRMAHPAFPKAPKIKFASGGFVESVPIVAAGGEYVVPPELVAHWGDGDLKNGHEALDRFVEGQRAQHIKTLRQLPGPKKD